MTNTVFKQFRQGIPAGYPNAPQQGQQQGQQPDIRQLYGQYNQDRMGVLNSCFKIPGDIGNDPNVILNYLTQSGQVTPQQLANARKMQAKVFGGQM